MAAVTPGIAARNATATRARLISTMLRRVTTMGEHKPSAWSSPWPSEAVGYRETRVHVHVWNGDRDPRGHKCSQPESQQSHENESSSPEVGERQRLEFRRVRKVIINRDVASPAILR